MLGQQSVIGEVDRIETPRDQRARGIFELALVLGQTIEHRVDARTPCPQVALRVLAVEETDIRELPHATGHDMGMCFDKSWHEYLVGERVVHRVLAPAGEFFYRANSQHPSVSHSHRFGERNGGVHRDDASCRIDRGCHGASLTRRCEVTIRLRNIDTVSRCLN